LLLLPHMSEVCVIIRLLCRTCTLTYCLLSLRAISRDPLGFLDGADEAKFTKLRYAEVKHGRIAMLAIVGHMVRTRIGWTGLIKCTSN
jgi:Chlorophyll A-B binding protein